MQWHNTRPRRDLVLIVFAAGLAVITFPRLAIAIVEPGFGESAWMGFNLRGLIDYLAHEEPLRLTGGGKQYGVVVFLIMDPAIRLFGDNALALNLWALVVGVLGIVGALVLCAARFFPGDRPAQLALASAWAAFTPTTFVLAQRHVEAIEIFLVALAMFLFTGSGVQRAWSGVPVVAAALAKLLPGVLFLYQAVREPRVILKGGAAAALLLLLGSVLYGPAIGVLYPVHILSASGESALSASTQQENQSLRGLIFKFASGFKLAPGDASVVTTSAAPQLNGLAYALQGSLLLYLLWIAWRGRADTSSDRRSLEFAFAIIAMLVVSPHTAHDPMILSLPAFTVLAYLWARGRPRRWPAALTGVAAAGAFLVGLFLPISIVARVIPVVPLMELAGNRSSSFFGANLGAYDLLGFPGVGLLLTLAALAWLERSWPLPERSASLSRA